MNLLDNAIAAQMVLPEEARFVGLKAQMRAGFLVVECSNAIKDGAQGSAAAGNAIAARNNTAVAREGVVAAVGAPATVAALRSMKQEHGWGQDILATIAARHGGMFETRQEANTYVCMVALGL